MTIKRYNPQSVAGIATTIMDTNGKYVTYEDFKTIHDIDVNQVKLHKRAIESLTDQCELLTNERNMLRQAEAGLAMDLALLQKECMHLSKRVFDQSEVIASAQIKLSLYKGESIHFSKCLEDKIKENNDLKMDKMCLEMDLDTLGADMSSLIDSLLKKGFKHDEIKRMARPK